MGRKSPEGIQRKSRRCRLRDVVEFLEALAPPAFAEPYDHPGLLSGSLSQSVSRVIVANDLTPALLEAAVKSGTELLVVHHPPLFPGPGAHGAKGLFTLQAGDSAPLLVQAALKQIAVYALHTQFDRAAIDAPQAVAKALRATIKGRLTTGSAAEGLVKLVVFVPESHIERVQEGVFSAGAGQIGRYDSCGFSITGQGTFRGQESTQPFIGKPKVLEKAIEARFETIFPRYLKGQVLKALRAAHPYEEIAYDLYSVDAKAPVLSYGSFGIGFFGEFQSALSFSDLAKRVKNAFAVRAFRLTGKTRGRFRRVAFSPGSGKGLLRSVLASGADLFITGELDYHQALEANRAGVAVIEVGHVESEVFFQPVVKNWLTELPINVKEWSRREQLFV